MGLRYGYASERQARGAVSGRFLIWAGIVVVVAACGVMAIMNLPTIADIIVDVGTMAMAFYAGRKSKE